MNRRVRALRVRVRVGCARPWPKLSAGQSIGRAWLVRASTIYAHGRTDGLAGTVPFDEDPKEHAVYLDHDYLERMCAMMRKVSAKERVIGWYHTGPEIREVDLEINEIFRRYVAGPVLVIIDVRPKVIGLPTEAYYAVEELKDDGTQPRSTFRHIASTVGAEEAEEVGVEHLLRDINDNSLSTLTNEIGHKLASLKGLKSRLESMHEYLKDVSSGRLPPNHEILGQIQEIFNLLPNVHVDEMVRSFAVKTNDAFFVIYMAALIRSVVALHSLLNNKIHTKSEMAKLDEDLASADAKAAAPAAASTSDGASKSS